MSIPVYDEVTVKIVKPVWSKRNQTWYKAESLQSCCTANPLLCMWDLDSVPTPCQKTFSFPLREKTPEVRPNQSPWNTPIHIHSNTASSKQRLNRSYSVMSDERQTSMKKGLTCQRQTGPRQANSVLIAYASSEGSGDPAHSRSLARTFAARSYKQWVKRNLQTESQIPGPSEWLGMRSYNLSWRNARRHKFAWRGSTECKSLQYAGKYGSINHCCMYM